MHPLRLASFFLLIGPNRADYYTAGGISLTYYYALKTVMLLLSKRLNIEPTGDAVRDLSVSDGDVNFAKKLYIGETKVFDVNYHHAPQSHNLSSAMTKQAYIGSGGASSGALAIAVQKAEKLLGEGSMSFPAGNSIDDLDEGDGIVTKKSQALLGTDILRPKFHTAQPDDVDTILSLIDDAPRIKKVRVLEAPSWARENTYSVFIAIAVEEYFLADIEITACTIDGKEVCLSSQGFSGEEDKDGLKPFNAYGPDFLKTREFSSKGTVIRDYNWDIVEFSPGEFYFLVPDLSEGRHDVAITFKNPAGKESELSFSFSRPQITRVEIPHKTHDFNDKDITMPLCVKDENHHIFYYKGKLIRECPQHAEPSAQIPITSCTVQDALFDNVLLRAEVHNAHERATMWDRIVRELYEQVVHGVTHGVTLTDFASWDGRDEHGVTLRDGGFYCPVVHYGDLYISAIGVENGVPAIALEADASGEVSNGGMLSVMGTNFDVSGDARGDYKLHLFKCDPTFIEPMLLPQDKRCEPHPIWVALQEAETRDRAYLNVLGIVIEDSEKGACSVMGTVPLFVENGVEKAAVFQICSLVSV